MNRGEVAVSGPAGSVEERGELARDSGRVRREPLVAELDRLVAADRPARAAETYRRQAQAARRASLASPNSCSRPGSTQNRGCDP